MAFWSRKKEKPSESGKAEGKSFKDFIEAAALEMEGLMVRGPKIGIIPCLIRAPCLWKRPKPLKPKKGPCGDGSFTMPGGPSCPV